MFLPIVFLFSNFLKLVLTISKEPLCLVVSFDAFRHDFLNKTATPHLYALSQLGARADYIRNIFPTKTFPNHFTIGTGVYAEDHGVLANSVFYNNSKHGYSYDLFHYNEDIVPIWTLNERANENRHSGSMMWPGGEFTYQGVKPTHVMAYNRTYEWPKRVDRVISWFLDDTAPANMVMLYFENPDYIGHRRGIHHPLFKEQIRRCDDTAKYIVEQLEKHGLKDKINVFILSDHGMVSVRQDHIIDLTVHADLVLFNVTGTSPVLQINAVASLDADFKKELINSTYQDLKEGESKNGHYKVYLKDNIPSRYRYKLNNRVSDILAVADIEFAFQDLFASIEYYRTKENMTVTPDSEFGVHGYDNTEKRMFPIFMGFGPDIKRSFTIAPFDNIDLYHLWARILHLSLPTPTPRFQLRGDVEHVAPMLVSTIPSFGLSTLTIGLLSFAVFTLMLLFSVLTLAIWNSTFCRMCSSRFISVLHPTHRDRDYTESGLSEESEALLKGAFNLGNDPDAGMGDVGSGRRLDPAGSRALEEGGDQPSSPKFR